MIDINLEIRNLVDYAVDKKLISERDKIYCINKLLEALNLDCYYEPRNYIYKKESVEDILDRINKWARENKLIENDNIYTSDFFDTYVISQLIQMPSVIEDKFYQQYNKSPEDATKYYYEFAKNSNYIREKRITKDIKWKHSTEYGVLDITINLSKPEKDPKMITKTKDMQLSKYPKCFLCKENEGHCGRVKNLSRSNHRVIGVELDEEKWYMHYSPYAYYNEHCILVKAEHEPMQITKSTFKKLLDFINLFPHYFIGSNAGLPIVGGSILDHEHYQGGNYSFAIANAKEIDNIKLKNNIEACTLKWPVNVIRLKGENKEDLVNIAYKILSRWKNYSDPDEEIYSHTDEIEHNTVTPIARCRDGIFELDIALRNNKTTKESPFGLYHAREEYHNIKKENIGLIEVMGLAVLPARLKQELELLSELLLMKDLEVIMNNKNLNKHTTLAKNILSKNKLNLENIKEIIKNEVGEVFLKVLKDAGIFKDTERGKVAFEKCRNQLFYGLKADLNV